MLAVDRGTPTSLSGPSSASFYYRPASDPKGNGAVEPADSEQRVGEQSNEHGGGRVGTEQVLGALTRRRRPDPSHTPRRRLATPRGGSSMAVPAVSTIPMMLVSGRCPTARPSVASMAMYRGECEEAHCDKLLRHQAPIDHSSGDLR